MVLPAFLVTVLKVLSPVAIAEGQKVAPIIAAEIKKIEKEAADRIGVLLASHNTKSILARAEEDVAAVLAFAQQHATLIRATAAAAVAATEGQLPPILVQLGLTGASGPDGPSGPTGSTGPA